MSSITMTFLTLQGRVQNVEVGPNMTLLQVSDLCKEYDLKSEEHSLKDQNKLSSQSKEIKQENEDEDESNDVSDDESENLFQFFTSDEEIPDISKWSHEMMAEYIKNFLPNEAHIFNDLEIDGASCLLLKRSDVLNCFQLKLGPAIRLYSLIIALQTKERDATLSWM